MRGGCLELGSKSEIVLRLGDLTLGQQHVGAAKRLREAFVSYLRRDSIKLFDDSLQNLDDSCV